MFVRSISPSITCGRARRLCRAFTLIELLVAVAIIAALLAIFVPVLSRSRRAVQSTQCLMNLRSVGKAWVGFSLESNGWVPHGGTVTDEDGWWWESFDVGTIDLWRGDYTPGEWVGMTALLDKELESEQTLFCPADDAWTDAWDNAQLDSGDPMLAGSFDPGHVGIELLRAMSSYAQRGVASGGINRLGNETRAAIMADLHHTDAGGIEMINHREGVNVLYSDASATQVSGPREANFDYATEPELATPGDTTWLDLDHGAFGGG